MNAKNSIKNNISKENIISDIKLTLSADNSRKINFLVVEGDDDFKFFKGFVTENVEIMESFSGKKGVKEIVSEVGNDRVIGICDRDYEKKIEQKHIFYYDYCCLEMMLISNNNVFKSIVDEYYPLNTDFLTLRLHFLNDIKWLSYFRKINSEKKLGIKFEGVSMHNSMNNENFTIENATEEVKKCNPNLDMKIFPEVLAECGKEHAYIELLDVTRGHDFINYFREKCTSSDKFNKRKENDIGSSLRCAYRDDDFKQTCLFMSIKKYSLEYHVTYFR